MLPPGGSAARVPVSPSPGWIVLNACSRVALAGMEDHTFDSVVTDPPYELGFMGKTWDASGVAFDPAFWREVLRVLKPGAHLLAFGGTRTYHRMACAIEDAGFEIRDSIHWMYGSGFPKSLNGPWGGTALKPAHEPIILARKPLVGTVAANVTRYGTGGLNIDGCRIATTDDLNGGTYSGGKRNPVPGDERSSKAAGRYGEDGRLNPEDFVQPAGRWPANVVLDEDAAAELDEQSGEGVSRKGKPRGSKAPGDGWGMTQTGAEYNDTGGASRFYYVAKASRSEREAGCAGLPARSGAEAVEREEGSAGTKSPRAGAGRTAAQVRNHHPTVKPIALMRWLCRLVTPPGGVVLDPFTGSGTTGIAAIAEGFHFVGIEREPEYAAIAEARIGNTDT